MARDRLRSAMAAVLGIGLTDLDALEYLESLGPMTQRDLGARLQLTSGAVTQLVDRLERHALVRRVPHPTDRRATLVQLLPDAALPELPELAEYHQELQHAAEELTGDEHSALTTFLQRVELGADAATAAMRGRRDARPSSGR
ncbi:MAG: MarR family winged helix-turn-helix transcriptional regulator [Nocardioidaceae bacterium]